jgi:hypothetical protein
MTNLFLALLIHSYSELVLCRDRGQTASYRAERQREQDKNAVEHAMLKMVQQLEQDVKSSKEEFVLARTRMLDTSKKLLRREREQVGLGGYVCMYGN